MGLWSPYNVIAFLIFCLFVQLASTDPLIRQVYRRQDTPSLTTVLDPKRATYTPSIASDIGKDETSYASSEMDSDAISTQKLSPTAVKSATNGISTSPANANSSRNSYNDLTSTDLPIKPRITPGFAVAGIILIISGILYGMTGIKNRWLQIYISSAFIAGIATTVLILYVINLPISNSTQAAYIVAVIATGAILGAVSILFSEITEGLCCLLGGFSLSMWLLVLHPNGLLFGNSKIALITIVTIGSFATSYSKYTRYYSQIFFISLGGATSIILGIDCFSRAGLKEFWAYLWALNPNLFPPEETSYPLTRGMRVEIASILIISVAGIISQIRLLKIVQERRKKKLDEELLESRKMEEEEENIGKKIVEETAKEKDQWEVVFRNEDKNHHLPTKSRTAHSMILQTESGKIAVVPSRPIDANKKYSSAHKGLEATNRGTIIVRVAQDIDEHRDHVSEIIEYSDPDTEDEVQSNDRPRLERQILDSSSISPKKKSTSAVSPVPVVIPLPFKVPEISNPLDSNRSSIGTQATLGDETIDDKMKISEQQLMTSISQPKASRDSKTASISKDLSVNSHPEPGTKGGVAPNFKDDIKLSPDVRIARNLSVASAEATQNSLSPSSSKFETPFSIETPELDIREKFNIDNIGNQSNSKVSVEEPMSPRSSISKTTEGQKRAEDLSSPRSSPPSITDDKQEINSHPAKSPPQNYDKSLRSRSSSVNSQFQKITRDTLPSHVSKIFMSYRTNEWAKHLEYAEKPEIEDLEKYDFPSHPEVENVEKPVPVRIQELQQTPENPHPPISHGSSNKFYRQSGIANSESNKNSDPIYQSRDKIITNNSQGSLVSQHSLVPSHRVNHLAVVQNAQNNLKFQHPTDSRSTLIESSRGSNGLPQVHHNSGRVRNSALINQRSSIARNRGLYKRSSGVSILDPNSAAMSQAGSSETASTYNCPLLLEDDETMSLSQRRDLIRQASVAAAAANTNQASHSMTYNTAQLRRMSSLPSSQTRQQQLAWWRASVRQDLQASLPPQYRIEQQRNMLRESQKLDEIKRLAEERKKGAREEAWNDMMRSQEMLDAHREALRRLQHKANQKVS